MQVGLCSLDDLIKQATEFNMKAVALTDHDVESNRLVAKKILEKLGCHATCVANGIEVLDILSRIKFDLILMDCHMPEVERERSKEKQSRCITRS